MEIQVTGMTGGFAAQFNLEGPHTKWDEGTISDLCAALALIVAELGDPTETDVSEGLVEERWIE